MLHSIENPKSFPFPFSHHQPHEQLSLPNPLKTMSKLGTSFPIPPTIDLDSIQFNQQPSPNTPPPKLDSDLVLALALALVLVLVLAVHFDFRLLILILVFLFCPQSQQQPS